jgi:peptidoglycan/LPS O-acetylase OafA/YrhL
MTINIFPDPDHRIWPGPYWFFGLMMELYLVYRLFLYRRHWGWNVGLIICCMAIQALCWNDPEGDAINRIRYNFMGNMMPFGIGLLLARWKATFNFQFSIFNFIIALAAIIALSFNFWTWLIVPFFVVIAHIGFIKMFSFMPAGEILVRGLAWVGGISAAIFVCHPITRKIFIPISRSGDILDGLTLYIIATIMLAMIFKKILKRE